ncbi:hypothetical protein [Pseudomonas fluorescens]|uniref:hypothetical protein n=1 Tax=Pseudomonas fluorescens TaxID=294 RepID=UPI001785199F|nr:hypothetical protein [Pseudomonas fluorescens]
MDKTLIKLLMVLLFVLAAAHGQALMFKSEPSTVPLNCAAAQSMLAESSRMNICPDMSNQVTCSISCSIPSTGAVTFLVSIWHTLNSSPYDCYTTSLGRMPVAPDPFPPKYACLS